MATVAIQPTAELTPVQKRFNTLLARVSVLSDAIATLEALSTQHRSSHLSAMAALQQQEDVTRKNLLLFLDARLHQAELTATHRRSATQIILALCEALAHKNDAQVQAVFNQHHSEEDAQALAEQAALEGVLTLRQSGWLKVIQGITSIEEVMATTHHG